MILTMLQSGTTGRVQTIRGKDAVKKHLGGLGFVAGSPVSVIAENGGNLIVNVKGTRIALSRQLACKIVLEGAPLHEEANEACRFAHASTSAASLLADF